MYRPEDWTAAYAGLAHADSTVAATNRDYFCYCAKQVLILGLLLAMVAVVAFSLTHNPYAIFIFGSLEFAANSGAWVVAETFTSEAFPTAVRGTAFSTALTIGRIVSIFAPLVVGSLAAATSLPVAYRLSVAPWLLAVVAFALARETRAVELSDA